MANTRTATKRARQALDRQARNIKVRSATRTVLRAAVEAIRSKDAGKTKEAYIQAVRALSKAASKGAIPGRRAARKVSRLTRLVKNTVPAALPKTK
jgi:small subunit ribosomal protein S20